MKDINIKMKIEEDETEDWDFLEKEREELNYNKSQKAIVELFGKKIEVRMEKQNIRGGERIVFYAKEVK